MSRSPLSSVASPQSTTRGGHQSASQLATTTGASPTPTASVMAIGSRNRRHGSGEAGVLLLVVLVWKKTDVVDTDITLKDLTASLMGYRA